MHRVSRLAAVLACLSLACTPVEGPDSEPPLEHAAAPLLAPAWRLGPPMREAHLRHTTTLLPSGKILVTGGLNASQNRAGAEVYDPATGTWSATGPMGQNRSYHTATLLPSGKVLVAGGATGVSTLATAELYNPTTNTWMPTSSMARARQGHSATLLPSGKVLVTAGISGIYLASSELYDPATGTWSATGALPKARYWHTATLLPSGKVLVSGGVGNPEGAQNRNDLYDPATGTWSTLSPLITARYDHIATVLPSGKVLVAGGYNDSLGLLASAELYDPVPNTWSPTGSMAQARDRSSATLLPSGKVLVMGGKQVDTLASAELYNPSTGTWGAAPSMSQVRYQHTSTLMPDGRVLVVGGGNDPDALSSVELYDPSAGVWRSTVPMSVGRQGHSGTLLPSGKVLVAGGYASTTLHASAELYDPTNFTWTPTGAMSQARLFHTATLLNSGKVLVTGGTGSTIDLPQTEEYDPLTGTWSPAGTLAQSRSGHTTTLLPSGKVLAVGGRYTASLASVEVYDPDTHAWSATGILTRARAYHTATLLHSGKVLVTGGVGTSGALAIAELYDPSTGTWSLTGALSRARSRHTATLLPSGKVLVTGGETSSTALTSTEVYDPATGTWSSTGNLATPRRNHVAVLMPSGKVIITSGDNTIRLLVTEEYDPVTGISKTTGLQSAGRTSPTATVIPSGQLLLTGGLGNAGELSSAEEYEPTGTIPFWKPRLFIPAPGDTLEPGSIFSAYGTLLRGLSEASSGTTHSSPTDFPLLSLMDMQQGRLFAFPFHDFSPGHVTATLPMVPEGHYLLSLTVNALTGLQVIRVAELIPDTTIIYTPPNPSNQSVATFSFVSTDSGAVFECSLDGDTFSPCVSSTTYAGLTEGIHSFQVRARDVAGNADPTPASYSWAIDLTPPEIVLVAVPANPSNQTFATFLFESNEAGALFECSLDGAAFDPCSSPATYSSLSEGVHALHVRARDAAGNVNPTPVSYFWAIDLTAPDTVIESAPPLPSNQSTATFTFSSNEAILYECSLDEGTFSACSPPVNFVNLPEGEHVFRVRARDAAGNVDPTPALHFWFIDLTAPDTVITTSPPNLSDQTVAFFDFDSNEGRVLFECSLDEADFSACSPPITLVGLSEGLHTFRVRARDAAGNVDTSPASYSWSIDQTAPVTILTSTPAHPSNQPSATFTFASESGALFECSLDGAAFGPCSSPATYSSLSEGEHVFHVRARDEAGNVNSTPVSYFWAIDLEAPDTALTSAPAGISNESSATFTFSSETGAFFECRLEEEASFSVCSSPKSYANLVEGSHTFQVRARDEAGNIDPTPASYSWSIDLSVPSAPVITSPADGATLSESQPVLSGTAQPGSSISLTLNGAVASLTTASETGAWSFTPEQPLADGAHKLSATATDTGGTSPAATVHFTVDTRPDDPPAPPDSGGGCDCAAGSGDASWLLGGLGLLARLTARQRKPRRGHPREEEA
ncbi:kelch repeat-containing protein [Hyalangium rubrum]|uniref:Kelch repeat-containing protein n=1 Tax=Hyalangium rubrum TaxID=3103134 RepID=A0ABU5H389_9BACT|nr:kelch repeat-containing protein [Hyalangium sp. s54d21]MDY7227928.1 kelch repeat-containing protein [Hyalangium sp. s54d21]